MQSSGYHLLHLLLLASLVYPTAAMVQSLNTKALLTLASVARRPYLMSPHVAVTTISDVNYHAIRQQCAVRAIVFDKDNTLTAPYANSLHPLAARGLRDAISAFGTDNVAILSNSAGTDDDPDFEDATMIEEALGVAVIRHSEKKPGGLEEVLEHFRQKGTELDDPSELCVVGDRLLTDVVFGSLHGMLTVHTLPLCSGKENVNDNTIAKVIRVVENKAMYGDWWGGRMMRKKTIKHKVWLGEEECPLLLPKGDDEDGGDAAPPSSDDAMKDGNKGELL